VRGEYQPSLFFGQMAGIHCDKVVANNSEHRQHTECVCKIVQRLVGDHSVCSAFSAGGTSAKDSENGDGRTVVKRSALCLSRVCSLQFFSSSVMKPTLVRLSDMPGRECARNGSRCDTDHLYPLCSQSLCEQPVTRRMACPSCFPEPLVGRQNGRETEGNGLIQCGVLCLSPIISSHSANCLALSPFQSRAAPKMISSYLFNGYRRLAGQAAYFVIPFALGASFVSTPMICPKSPVRLRYL
jgi:hypothetical protein